MRPLVWEHGNASYVHERIVGTPQAGLRNLPATWHGEAMLIYSQGGPFALHVLTMGDLL